MEMPGRESEAGESVTVTMRLRADAQVLSAPFDDTQPFPPPLVANDSSFAGLEETPVTGVSSPLCLEGSMSLEQATELGLEELRTGRRSPPPNVGRHSEALVPACDADAPASSSRLCWRGIEVSDEFQGYALRVARGEELAPYRGRVLASGAPDFPWQATAVPTRGRRAARLAGLAIGAVLAALTAALGLLQAPPDASYREPFTMRGPAREPRADTAALPPAADQTRAHESLTVPASLKAPSTPPTPTPAPKQTAPAARAARRPTPDAPHAPTTPASPLLVEAPPF
jgi:hypothetical protein